MCENCSDFNEKKYPDLGDGSAIHFDKLEDTGLSADRELGLRVFQERDVTYMGIEGVVSKNEIECVYIPWEIVMDLIVDMGELYMATAPSMVKTADWLKLHSKDGND